VNESFFACPELDSGRPPAYRDTVQRRSPEAEAFGEGLGKPLAADGCAYPVAFTP